jgi:hypothetical protein
MEFLYKKNDKKIIFFGAALGGQKSVIFGAGEHAMLGGAKTGGFGGSKCGRVATRKKSIHCSSKILHTWWLFPSTLRGIAKTLKTAL